MKLMKNSDMVDYSELFKEELQEKMQIIDDEIEDVEREINDARRRIDDLEWDIEGYYDNISQLERERATIERELNDITEWEKPDPNQIELL